MKVGRKIVWPRKRSGQLVAPLFRRVNGQPSTGHQLRLFISFRPDVILLFGKGRLGGREWECGFAKIGTRTCLDFMTALLEFKRYERRIYSVIHWRNLYSINELRWIFMQISYYRVFPYYFTQMLHEYNVSVVSVHKNPIFFNHKKLFRIFNVWISKILICNIILEIMCIFVVKFALKLDISMYKN